jgi:protein-S-isoprenylcysteine O-methyltransferase Ste14
VEPSLRQNLEAFARIALFVLMLFLWLWVLDQRFSSIVNLSIIVGGVLLAFPVVWLGREVLDKKPSMGRVTRVTMFVHYTVLTLIGMSVCRAVVTHREWSGWILPVPGFVGLVLVIVTGAASLLAVVNLALKGLGAPFAIALSRKLAVDWMYARTRNPMVLATLGLFFSMAIWFQSALFLLWVLLLVTPALLSVVKIYEERELELRFGAPYLEYKSSTPMLIPRLRRH